MVCFIRALIRVHMKLKSILPCWLVGSEIVKFGSLFVAFEE
ncbi:hypothetical protein HPHPH28_1596 [Helicobacter pylori Hp H-28]|nr:hypothetical protein HPHPH28_1596 [Helicobacter pylori Hp H-28]